MNIFKRIYYKTTFGRWLIYLNYWMNINLLPDKTFIKRKYRKVTGKKLNLKNPKTLNEKICWLKLYDRTPLHTQCADKFAVREFVKANIGEEFLVPLYYHTKNSKAINAQNITEYPCIIKTNHDSSGGIFVHDPTQVNWEEIQLQLEKRLKSNYYPVSKEWQYKNIVPKIIVEKLLQDSKGQIPLDYKLHCFNGKVHMVQVDIGRDTDNHHRNWYSSAWEREPYAWSSPKEGGKYTDPSDEDVEKPKTLKQMIALSEVLSQPFDYVRVDWYDVDGILYFGEVTFHHDGGYQLIRPEKWDLILGEKVVLTSK